MKKNLLILGTSRMGKTMLANMIASNLKGYSKISIDALKLSFKEVFPDLGVGFNKEKVNLIDFPKFVETLFDINCHKDNQNGIFYVIEGEGIPEDVVLKFKEKKNLEIIYVGKTKITPQEFFEQIRHYENIYDYGGWTKRLDDDTLLSWCSSWINQSKKYKQFCEENNLIFVDTSFDQQEVLKNVLIQIDTQIDTLKSFE